ncbi:MAG: MBL fold metallo-hydrolase [Haloarculaceae archaeon]
MGTHDVTTPDGVHHLALEVEFGDGELRLDTAAIETDHGLLLVDTGVPGTIDPLTTRLRDAGFKLRDVATVLITHQDADHAGNLADLRERVDPFVLAHEAAARVVDGREPPRGSDGSGRYPPASVDLELRAEATIRTRGGPARVVPTPGHTPGHVSLYFPDSGFLLAADALTAEEGRLSGPRPDVTEDVKEANASVERLAALDVEQTLCYHGGLVDAGSDRIAEIAAESA